MNSGRWTVIYYSSKDGQPVVTEEIKSFSPKAIAKIVRTINLLSEIGILIGGDYVDHISEKLWELRVDRYRVLYFMVTGRKFVMLRAFIKKTRKTPIGEIRIAETRINDYLEQFGENNG